MTRARQAAPARSRRRPPRHLPVRRRGRPDVGVEHLPNVGELVLRVSAPGRRGVYREAVRGLGDEISGGHATGRATERRPVALDAADGDVLLADLLNDAIFTAETEGLVPCGLEVRRLEGGHLDGDLLLAHPSAAPRHVVKAATYHDVRVWHDEGTWWGNVVLDV
jgi:SHS2 domain-containing protein